MTNTKKYLFEIISLPLLLLIAFAVSLYLKTPNDDAFIYLVYVKNFLAGNGLTFNGTVVEGYSSPFWAALLSVLGLTGLDLVGIAQGASLVFAFGCIVLTFLYCRKLKLNKWLSLVPAFFLAFSGDLGVYALSGLETFCFTFFVLLSFFIYTHIQDNNYFKSISLPMTLALAAWVRPEGLLLFTVFLAGLLLKTYTPVNKTGPSEIKNIIRFILIFIAAILPLFILRYIFYGELLPNTYYAKAGAGLANLHLGVDYFKNFISNFSFLKLYVLPILLFSFIFNRKKLFTEYAFIGTWVLYVTLVGGDNMLGGRRFLPMFPVVYVLIVYAFNDLIDRINPSRSFTGTMRNCTIMFIGFLMGIYVFYNYTRNPAFVSQSAYFKTQAANWRMTGEYLKENFPKDTWIAVIAAGMVPYYSELPAIDILGLNDRHIAHNGKRDRSVIFAHQSSDFEYVLSKDPDVIVFGFLSKYLTEDIKAILHNPDFKKKFHRINIKELAILKRSSRIFKVYVSNRHRGKKYKKLSSYRERKEKLSASPFLSLDILKLKGEEPAVVKYDTSLAHDGYNIYFSADKGEAYLMDMNGKIVHTWIWSIPRSTMWQTVEMLDNGDLLVACLYCGLFKVDWDSNLIFSKKRWSFHHNIEVLPDNTLLVLSHDFHKYRGTDVSFDTVLHLTKGGDLISKWSTFENIENIGKLHKPSIFDSEELITRDTREKYKHFLVSRFNIEKIHFYDYYHTDTIETLPENPLGKKDKRFQAGNRLLSFRNVDLIVIIDKDTGEIVWSWGPGKLDVLSSPSALDNGHILIFDSRGNYGYSKVIELDPSTMEIVWEYKGDPPESFFSITGGYAQRLANGNTLISESAHGRVIEVTNKSRIVWEWLNPEIDKETRLRKSFYRMRRLDKDLITKLLKEHPE